MTSRLPAIIWVFDTSPLIHLDQLGYLPILNEIVKGVVIPPAVRTELRQGRGRPGAHVHKHAWVEVRTPDVVMVSKVRREFAGGAGETEALALALELNSGVVIDEKRARKYADRRGLIYTGVLGILSATHSRGLAERSLAQDLQVLEQSGMRLSETIKADFVRRAKQGL
jgi:predicted nucleic acid-binding protein